MLHEFNIAKDLTHKNIVKYLYFITKKLESAFEFNIVLEFMQGGNLKEFIHKN